MNRRYGDLWYAVFEGQSGRGSRDGVFAAQQGVYRICLESQPTNLVSRCRLVRYMGAHAVADFAYRRRSAVAVLSSCWRNCSKYLYTSLASVPGHVRCADVAESCLASLRPPGLGEGGLSHLAGGPRRGGDMQRQTPHRRRSRQRCGEVWVVLTGHLRVMLLYHSGNYPRSLVLPVPRQRSFCPMQGCKEGGVPRLPAAEDV